MTLAEQEEFLRATGWGWYLEVLALKRDALNYDESMSPFRDGIVKAKRDYYAKAVAALADRFSESKSN